MPLPVISDEPKKEIPQVKSNHLDEEQTRVKAKLQSIGKRIGVHSGKGGVGKTFVAANIAMLLAAEGYSVGLLDADIDCPNIPSFLNSKAELMMDDDGKLIPLIYKGVKIVSTGFINDENEPLIIRGPIKHRVLIDFLENTNWGPLDYLIIDFPPGTSDVPLSAMQNADLTGLILVSTPQKESIADVIRAHQMAEKLGVPILGLIENMAGEIFGNKGEEIAKKLNINLIASIPLSKHTRELSDKGDAAFLDEMLAEVANKTLNALR